MQPGKHHLFPCFKKSCNSSNNNKKRKQQQTNKSLRMLSLNCFIITSDFNLVSKKCEKMQPVGFALRWTCDTQTRPRSVRWYKLAKVNSANMHGEYEHNWSKSLCAMSNVKVFATYVGRPAGQTNTIHYISPYDTHTDQKWYKQLFSVSCDKTIL